MASNDEQRSATTILTTAAQSIAARLIANETTAKFTKAEISTTNLFNQSVTELQVLTSLDNVQQTADINTVTVINNNTVNVNVAIDQTKAPNNYQMNSVGLFAVDGDGKEVLYSVTVLKDPVYIHQDAMGSALGIDLETVVGQASNVEISVNPAGAVTNEILKAALADYVKADDSTVVHTADMRKPANQVASIDEVNAKADVSAVDQLKTNLTNQVSTLQTQVDNSAVGANLVAQSDLKGRYLDRDKGGITFDGGSDFYVDNYIPTNGSTVFTFSSPDYIFKGSIDCTLAMYDSDKKYLAYQNITTATQTLSNPNTVYIRFSINFKDEGGTSGGLSDWLSAHRYKLEKGSVATDWCPNPDDKVNVADMRKPASDVAGIEEVNAKQDKIGYTPADDSTVLHNNALNQILTDNSGIIIGNDKDFGFIKRENYKGGLAIGSGNSFHFMATNDPALSNTSEYHDVWTIAPSGKLSILGGAYFIPADDSKVVHLSGANNFDTTPTVNNNPLLLASSLPSDLARTSQQANFTGKLQKSGVDVATVDDVSAKQDKLDYTPANDANTFHRSPDTGAVTESGNFPGLQVKGVDVATAADLKSVEESAWREITNPAFQGSYLFRDNEDGTASLAGTIYFYNRSQQYNGNDDYIVPMPDGYKATGVASEGSLMGFINDFSVSLQGLKAYFPGTALHLYTDLNQNRPLSIPLCSIISSSATGITSSPIVLKVVKTS